LSWPLGKVSDIGEVISGFAFKSDWFGSGSAKVIRIGDLQNGRVQIESAQTFDDETHQVREQFKIQCGDILMALSGATVGKIAIAGSSINGAYLNQRVAIIRGKSYESSEYLKYVFSGSPLQKLLSNAGGAAQPNLSPKDLAEMEIPLPPLPEQKRIAAILDKANAIRRKRQQAIQLADDFLRAVFLDMFGDPVTNPKGWTSTSLLSHGAFKNGLNYGKEDSGTSIRCLGVGDFKAFTSIGDVSSLSTIELNRLPADDYFLEDGDLVFVRSNGNKALVGRSVTVYPQDEKVTFSGFCIRYRCTDNMVEPEYLNFMFRTPSMKQAMLSGGQGANIQNINQKRLSEIHIPIPPKELQMKFVDIVRTFKNIQTKNNSSFSEFNTLFGSISQKAFTNAL
jgi:type I restriction enzyme S subunit